MRWEHTCSLVWLQARQRYLCASEVKRLLPMTKTGRYRKVTDLDRMAVYADKLKRLTHDDCLSFGAAARGHMLEPYAVDAFNNTLNIGDVMYHWDDVIIPSEDGMLAFSPDGLNVPQEKGSPTVAELPEGASRIVEVKCYSPDRHMLSLCTPQDELEERWQIATAMAAHPAIEDAALVFFNPSLRGYKMGAFTYDRDDLQDEIGAVLEVAEKWREFVGERESCLSDDVFLSPATVDPLMMDEEYIVSRILQEEQSKLNPR